MSRRYRCKFYDDDGSPQNGGCRRIASGGCYFAHPSDPEWPSAAPPKPYQAGTRGGGRGAPPSGPRRGRGGAPGGGFGGGGGGSFSPATPAAWGDSAPAAPATSWDNGGGGGWDTGGSGWDTGGGAPSGNQDAGNKNDSGSGWTWDNADTGASTNKEKDSGWGNLGGGWGDSGATTGGGWGSTGGGGGWPDVGGTTNDSSKKPSGTHGDRSNVGWGVSNDSAKKPRDVYGDNSTSNANAEKGTSNSWARPRAPLPEPPRFPRKGDRRGSYKDADENWPVGEAEGPVDSGWGSHGANPAESSKAEWGRRDSTSTVVAAPQPRSSRPRVTSIDTSASRRDNAESRSAETQFQDSVDDWQTEKPRTLSPGGSIVTPVHTTSRKRKRSVEMQARREAWKETIKQFARAVRAREALDKAETERDDWRRAQSSASFVRVGQLGKTKLDGYRSALEAKIRHNGESLSAALTSLTENADISNTPLEFYEKYDVGAKVKPYVDEAIVWIQDMRPLLTDLISPKPLPRDSIALSQASSLEEGQIMNDPLSPKKQHPPLEEDAISSIRRQFSELENRIDEMETEISLPSSQKVLDGIDEKVQAKFEAAVLEAKALQTIDTDRDAQDDKQPVSALQTQIDQLQQKAAEVGKSIESPISYVAALITTQHNLKEQGINFEQENAALKQLTTQNAGQLAHIRQRLTDVQREVEQSNQENQRLQALVQAYLAEPRHTDEIPPHPDMECLSALVEAKVLDVVTRDIEPTLAQVKDVLSVQISNNSGEVFTAMFDRLQPALRLAEAICTRLENHQAP